ncbi:MBL fold metallo-hydrolase [Bacillus toyonensis]|uniref:MBL fold protein n=1 Tax=Bacillus toyonensis TaxID=155322 RepID=UPI000CD9A92F|nr:MBL fold protein [Bacillus toyonensis]MED3541312.1 MBL fold metallo-hydrolase [Bacillus toyonensis]
MGIYLKVLPAANGDSFLIKIREKEFSKNILIDGGKGVLCQSKLKQEFQNIKQTNDSINLLIVTHIDDDHISGILKLYQDKKVDKSIVKEVWFNSGILMSKQFSGQEDSLREIPLAQISRKMSVTQGITLEDELKKSGNWYQGLITSEIRSSIDNTKITVLSPDLEILKDLNIKWIKEMEKLKRKKNMRKKMSASTDYHHSYNELCKNVFEEDNSLFNKSSIAFLLEHEDKKLLMLGDSHPSVIINSLHELGYCETNKLKVDLMKVSHHGSKKNTNVELLKMIDCVNFVVSSDGSKHGLPNKECLSRIICTINKPLNFYFNYSSMNRIFTAEECRDLNINCIFLTEDNDYTLEVR